MGTKVVKKKKRRRKERVSFTSKLWSLVMEKSSQVIKVEENVYKKKCIRNYGVKRKKKKKKKKCKPYISICVCVCVCVCK